MKSVILALSALIGLMSLIWAVLTDSLVSSGLAKENNILVKPGVLFFISALFLLPPLIRLFRAVERFNDIET